MIWLVIISLIIHLLYYVVIFSRLSLYSINSKKNKDIIDCKFSILVCYKNEEGNIIKHIQRILSQGAEEYILVDDFSTDNTSAHLKSIQSDTIKVISPALDKLGKKEAMLTGLRMSRNQRVILTDGDCIPATEQWASILNSYDSEFVLGYAPMNQSAGYVNLFSRYETFLTALQYLSYALWGMPYMGVGRNMLINKTTVLNGQSKVKGKELISGDDDLTINALANAKNTSICIEPDSFVYSDSKVSLGAFLRQKARHISTSTYYLIGHQLLLSLFSLSQITFYLGIAFGLLLGLLSLNLVLCCILIKWVIQQAINYFAMKKLNEMKLFMWFPVLDLLIFAYFLIMPFYLLLYKNKNHWN